MFLNALVQHIGKYISLFDKRYQDEIEILFETSDEYINKQIRSNLEDGKYII